MAKQQTAEIPGIVHIGVMGDKMAIKAGRDDLGSSAFLKAFGLEGKGESVLVFDTDNQLMGLRPSFQLSNPELSAQIKGSEWAGPEKLGEVKAIGESVRQSNPAYRQNGPTVAAEDRQQLFVPLYKVEGGQVVLDEQTKMPTPVGKGFISGLKAELPTLSTNLSEVINFVSHAYNPATGTEGSYVVSKKALEQIGGLKDILAPYMPSPESQEKARVAFEFDKTMPATVNRAAERMQDRDRSKVYIPPARVVGNGLSNLVQEFSLLDSPKAFQKVLQTLDSEKGKVEKQISVAEQSVANAMFDIDKACIARGDKITENGVDKARYTQPEERAALKQARIENRLEGNAPKFGERVQADKLPLPTILNGYAKATERLQQEFEKRKFRDDQGQLISFDKIRELDGPAKAATQTGPAQAGQSQSATSILQKFGKGKAAAQAL